LARGSLSAIQRLRKLMRVLLRYVLSVVVGLMGVAVLEAGDFRVRPYLQNPASDAMSVRWLSNSNAPGTRGGTGWLALEPTGVPWHKRSAVIDLWL